MAYEGTEVAAGKSQDAIRKLIFSHKGSALSIVSQPPREGFNAMVKIGDVDYHVRIMATGKYKTAKTRIQQEKWDDQENRRIWRVLYWHLKAMFEASDSGVIDIRDVVMPYVVMRDGKTLSEHIAPIMPSLMTMDTGRLLEAGA